MKFKLNCSPHLRMHEITKKLFNLNFLSDVQFSVGGKIIYAHSLELMKRSTVFEAQLKETWGEKKLIPITDCTYETFLEFVRFLYTDECEITDGNGIDLLKLAIKYNVIMLESRVINTGNNGEWILNLFGHCVTEKYEMAYNRSIYLFTCNLGQCHSNAEFLSLHPNAVNKALHLEHYDDMNEMQIYNAVARWIENYCKQHQMSLTEGRQQFEGLIKKIRFPAMSNDEIRDCANKYPYLLSDSDLMTIGKQVLFGSNTGNDVWISKRRNEWKSLEEFRKFKRDTVFETKFTASMELILHGLWIGIEKNRNDIEIEITTKNLKTRESEKIQIIQSAPSYWDHMLTSLGESLRVKPNFEYTIAIKYLEVTDEFRIVLCRKENVDLICNNPENSVEILKASDNMIEMVFKKEPQ